MYSSSILHCFWDGWDAGVYVYAGSAPVSLNETVGTLTGLHRLVIVPLMYPPARFHLRT
jgi:hypothetical protein